MRKKQIESKIDFKKYENLILNKIGFKNFIVSEKDLKKYPKNRVFSIIMPPPNANGNIHLGHALFLMIQDTLIRYYKTIEYLTFWLPGFDHAGFETQVVVENNLQKEGESRFDFSKENFFSLVENFVNRNRELCKKEIKRLWVGADWQKEKFTLDKDIVKFVYYVFKKMYNEGLIYRAFRPVNYCAYHQTAFSDLEVEYKKEKAKLYFIKYKITKSDDYLLVATTRPETIFADLALAINPKDNRYKKFLGKTVLIPLINKEIPIISHPLVNINFGTGILKITPAHDFRDWIIAQQLKIKNFPSIIDDEGKINEQGYFLKGLTTEEARAKIVQKLKDEGLLEKEEDYEHEVPVCYKCKSKIEIIPKLNWFINIKPLAKRAISEIKKNKIKFIPAYGKKRLLNWLENIVDWNISRQIIWGIPIPVYYCENEHINISEKGIKRCRICKSNKIKKEESVFDTWFSSSLWPVVTLVLTGKKIKRKKHKLPFTSTYFEKFYPTTLMETGYDILYFWVARMIMFGLYLTNDVPFKYVYLHGIIRDEKGEKMSKSKGNVVNPLNIVERYGVDALRIGLLMNLPPGEDLKFSEEKIISGRNFSNKVWNIARFIYYNVDEKIFKKFFDNNPRIKPITKADKIILAEEKRVIKKYHQLMKNFEIHKALNLVYYYTWRKLADIYIEKSKNQLKEERLKENTQFILIHLLNNLIKLLHPFLPITTTAIVLEMFPKNRKIL